MKSRIPIVNVMGRITYAYLFMKSFGIMEKERINPSINTNRETTLLDCDSLLEKTNPKRSTLNTMMMEKRVVAIISIMESVGETEYKNVIIKDNKITNMI
jgi:hypothetical protein